MFISLKMKLIDILFHFPWTHCIMWLSLHHPFPQKRSQKSALPQHVSWTERRLILCMSRSLFSDKLSELTVCSGLSWEDACYLLWASEFISSPTLSCCWNQSWQHFLWRLHGSITNDESYCLAGFDRTNKKDASASNWNHLIKVSSLRTV